MPRLPPKSLAPFGIARLAACGIVALPTTLGMALYRPWLYTRWPGGDAHTPCFSCDTPRFPCNLRRWCGNPLQYPCLYSVYPSHILQYATKHFPLTYTGQIHETTSASLGSTLYVPRFPRALALVGRVETWPSGAIRSTMGCRSHRPHRDDPLFRG